MGCAADRRWGSLSGVSVGHSVSVGLYPQTRFYRLRLVPHCPRSAGAGVFLLAEIMLVKMKKTALFPCEKKPSFLTAIGGIIYGWQTISGSI